MRVLFVVLGLISLVAPAGAADELGPADPGATSVVTVSLRARSAVTGPQVLVRDIADLRGGTPDLRTRIGGLDVADLADTVVATDLLRDQVVFRLRIAGVEPASFRVEGPPRVQVDHPGRPIVDPGLIPASYRTPRPPSPDDVVRAAREHLLARIPWQPADVEVRSLQAVAMPVLTLDESDLVTFKPELPTSDSFAGRVRVDVAFMVKGERAAVTPVYFEVRLYQNVAVTTRSLQPGDQLTKSNVHCDRQAVEATRILPTFTECLSGFRARRALPAGQVLSRTDVDQAPEGPAVLVHARDAVKIVAHVGPLKITATGEAVQDGRAGQLIRVRNTDSGKVVLGRVLDKTSIGVED